MSLNNDKEFENLYKRSSESYPLNTDSSDWEYVLNKLEEKEEKKGFFFRKKLLLVLLLLIAVGVISSLVTGLILRRPSNSNNKTAITTNKDTKADTELKNENKIADAVYKKVIDSIKKTQPLATANLKEQKITGHTPEVKQLIVRNKKVNTAGETNSTVSAKNTKEQVALAKSDQSETKPAIKKQEIVNKPSAIKETEKTQTIGEVLKTDESQIKTDAATVTKEIKPVVKASNESSKEIVKVADTTVSNAQKTASKAKTKSSFTDKHFYGGLLYATDKSSLRFESTPGKGYSWAVVLGYKFNKLLSIETGFHIEKKEYFSAGESFANKKILPATGTILWVESENKLIEIPITLKVDYLNTRKHNLSATVGFSSYLVNREFYEYEEEINGVLHDGSVLYANKTSNLFATANLSLGYQFKFGNIGNLRIEPYVNLPLRGIGKGKEPVISRGVFLGWIYDFPKRKLKH